MKTIKILLAAALSATMAAGCVRQELVELPEDQEFTASLADAASTKTVLWGDDKTSIWWQTDESINVFLGDSMAGQFHSTNAEPAATATFRGSLVSVAGAAGSGTDYWALYPYDAEAVCDGTSVTLTVPDLQQGMAGTFANNLFPALAKSSTRTLQFYNVCGGARFSVTEEGVTSVIIRSIGGDTLAGKVKVGFDGNGKPAVQEVLDGVSEVTVTAPEGGFEVGENYFAALLPGVYERGLTLTFVGGAGNTTRAYSHAITINRSRFGQLDEVDNGIWDETHRYFTITSQADGNTISFMEPTSGNVPEVNGTFSYSLDQGATWTSIGAWESLAGFSHTLNDGETLSLKGDLDKTCFGYQIGIPEAATVSGNIMSLVSGDGFADVTELDAEFAFYRLFQGSAVTDASELVLPATTLADWCYSYKFSGCTSLTSAPELPATTLADECYDHMFYGCSSLISAPELPATTLAEACYHRMFSRCARLTSAPELPATTLALGCYSGMFEYCTSLTSAPELPATTLADVCYFAMFQGCTSLTSAPELSATTLTTMCYDGMFWGCTSLTSAPELPATTLTTMCYDGMFLGCTSLTSAPELPATTLAFGCYSSMFQGCTSLTSAPELPATTLADNCYSGMFSGCTSLTSAPELPASTLVDGCYTQMFKNCSNLSYVKALFTTTPSDDYTENWLAGVAATGTFVKSADATWDVVGPGGVPEGWTVQMEGEASGGTEGIGYDEW